MLYKVAGAGLGAVCLCVGEEDVMLSIGRCVRSIVRVLERGGVNFSIGVCVGGGGRC